MCAFGCKYQIKVDSPGSFLLRFFPPVIAEMNLCSPPPSPPTQVEERAHTHTLKIYENTPRYTILQIEQISAAVCVFTHGHNNMRNQTKEPILSVCVVVRACVHACAHHFDHVSHPQSLRPHAEILLSTHTNDSVAAASAVLLQQPKR